MTNLYETFEKPMIKILALMEIEGIMIDSKFLKTLSLKFEKKIKKIQNEVFKISKKEFNIASPKQRGNILFGKMKLVDKPKKTKTGEKSTGIEVLEDLAYEGNKVADTIIQWRQISKLKNTYSDS